MAYNVIFSDISSTRRHRTVGSKVAPGTPGVEGTRPFVTYSGSGDHPVTSRTLEGIEYVVRERGGVGLEDHEATVSYGGTVAFDVEGADEDTAVEGEVVYFVPAASQPTGAGANIKTGTLTLDDAAVGAVPFGTVDFFRGEYSATDTAVVIGEGIGA